MRAATNATMPVAIPTIPPVDMEGLLPFPPALSDDEVETEALEIGMISLVQY